MAAELARLHRSLYPEADPAFAPRVTIWASDCFTGRIRPWLAADVGYHNLAHTFDVTLCLARLLAGRALAGIRPVVDRRRFEMGIIAALFHDSGYLKADGDATGTGAKHTFTHVARGQELAGWLLAARGWPADDVQAVQRIIECTHLESDLAVIPFGDEIERLVGLALGTADLLGQMASPHYLAKLPALHAELVEAGEAFPELAGEGVRFADPTALARSTPEFWENFVRPRLDHEFGGLYRFLAEPYPDGPNRYLEGVTANLKRIRKEFGPAA